MIKLKLDEFIIDILKINLLEKEGKMSSLIIYEMGHGDCFLLKDEFNEGLLIDCGGSRRATSIVRKKVSNDLLGIENKSLLITHFHRDHVNKINDINKGVKFHNVYIPNGINYVDIHIAFAILKTLSKNTNAYAMAYNFLTFIPKIEDYITNDTIINFVSRFSILNFSFCSFKVLWPENFTNYKNEKIDFLIEKIFTDKEMIVIKKYLRIFSEMDEKESISSFKSSNYKETSNQISMLVDFFANQKVDKERIEKYKDDLKKISAILGNHLSLVLYDEEKKSLFTGDITRKIFEKEISKYIPKNINILKSPHHGSKTHYSQMLPKANHIIITEYSDKNTIDYVNYYFRGNYSNLIVCSPNFGKSGITHVNNSHKMRY